jgi:hypothetical protein
MRILSLVTIALLLSHAGMAAEFTPIAAAKQKADDQDIRMAFSPWKVFADRSTYTNFNGSKYSGIAPGIGLSYLEGWEIGKGAPATFDGGGYIRFTVGFGKIKSNDANNPGKKNWIPYDFSLGPYGSYVFKNPNHELGFDYGMIGIYGYSVYAYFGSQFTAKYRYRFLQLDATRGGDGIFRGCFVPRFGSEASHSIGITALLPKGLLAGFRYSTIPSGGGTGHQAEEWRLFFGMNISNI